ncbi:hypothetical protein ACFVT9_28250 [Kitasatospora cineracea]|uniref:hypothetical protein n=1 Tax=Kitasatospora cineracea TaxID=88074 RepID=UPI0036DE3818
MNPHDPLTSPGDHLIHERLGTDDLDSLHAGHRDENAAALLAQAVHTAAGTTNRFHRQLASSAQRMIERLSPIARGSSTAMLNAELTSPLAGPGIEVLAARYISAYHQLVNALRDYERYLRLKPNPAAPARMHGQGPSLLAAASRDAGSQPAPESLARQDPGGFDLRALRDIKRHDHWLRQRAFSGHKSITCPGGGGTLLRVETAERLIADGLVAADTSTPSGEPGHLLSLTPEGEAALSALEASHRALEAAHRAERRAGAALYRSTAVGAAPAETAPAAAPLSRPLPSSSPSR